MSGRSALCQTGDLAQLIQQVSMSITSKKLDDACLVPFCEPPQFAQTIRAVRRQKQRLGAFVALSGSPLHQAAVLKPVEQGDKVRSFDAKGIRDVGVDRPRIVFEQHEDGKFRRPNAKLSVRSDDIGKHRELCTPQKIARMSGQFGHVEGLIFTRGDALRPAFGRASIGRRGYISHDQNTYELKSIAASARFSTRPR